MVRMMFQEHAHEWEVIETKQDSIHRFFDTEIELKCFEKSICKCGAIRQVLKTEVVWESDYFADS